MNTDKIYAEAIANEYAPKDTSKVVALKKLDNKAKMPANIFAFSFGTIMALVLGTGMCLSMKVIGNGSTSMMAVGIIVGIIGINLMIFYLKGIWAIIQEWLDRDCKESVEKIAGIIESCVRPENALIPA